MNSNINEILKKIESLQRELGQEYEELLKKYSYQVEKNKITFIESIKKQNKQLKQNLFKYIFSADIRHIISIPFIYSMLLPMLILDLFLYVYQTIAFPLYRIPKVKRSDYIVYDRKFLDYLNVIQKINCLYCSYGNGLFAYAVEVAARTEKYWCPIKAATRPMQEHRYYKEFADYGDAEGFFEAFNKFDNPDQKAISVDDAEKK